MIRPMALMPFAGLAACGLLLAGAWAGDLPDASEPVRDGTASLRLLAGAAEAGTVRTAGVEIAMQPGWHTYWRYAGDSGVAPAFDFSASDNVADVAVAWPAPQEFDDGSGGRAVGYAGAVIFPLTVQVKDPAAPVVLRLDAHYAVCGKLCVPAQARTALPLGTAGTRHDVALAAARMRVPQAVAMGADRPLAVQAARIEQGGAQPRIVLDIRMAGTPAQVFVEGPDARWALPIPRAAPGASAGQQRYIFAAEGVPKGAMLDGATLRVTAVAGTAGSETTVRLDRAQETPNAD